MEPTIHILHLEDDPADAELIQATLESANLTCEITRVQTRDEFSAALRQGGYDVILGDFWLPMYDGMSALRLAQEQCPDVPFIFVSGTLGEDAAIQALTEGATEYVLKQKLSRLVPAVKSALRDAKNRNERKRAEDALRESERKFRELYDHAPVGYHEYDSEGRITRVNRTDLEMLGYTAEEMVGQPLWKFNVEEETARRLILEKLAGVRPPGRGFERTYRRKDGTTLPVLIEDRLILDNEGRIQGIRCAVQDISERKKAEQKMISLQGQLRQAQKMEALGTLAGGIAHDFNNILAAIIGYAEMALLHVSRDSSGGQSLAQVLKASDRAKELVKQILAFSRKSEQEKKKIKIGPIIKEALKLLRASLPSTIEIRCHVPTESDTLLADPIQIHQVLMNLCTNAAHALRGKGGVLEVRLTDVEPGPEVSAVLPDWNLGPCLKLTVSDTGHGISPEILDRIFDPYFTTKEPGEGTGLGLAVVHGIVKSHGGAIRVESEPGKGTAFHLYFPKVEAVTEKAEAFGPLPRAGENERILFVDDEEALVMVQKGILEHFGYQVTASSRAKDALEIFRDNPERFDLVITDQTMPGLTGGDFAGQLLAIRPKIPIILCTGFSPGMTPEKAKALGIRELLMKPYRVRDLVETVRRVLDGKG